MPNNKEIKALVRQAEGWAGWRVEAVKKGWMIYPADKNFGPINVHKTPSDHRAWKNTLARLKKAGAPL